MRFEYFHGKTACLKILAHLERALVLPGPDTRHE
jgi:hypothetical protein